MRIGINTRLLIDGKMEGIGWYTYEVTKRLVQSHPEHEFVLFFDRPWSTKFEFGPNAKNVVLGPQARHPILFKIWFNRSISKALKKYDIDVFFSPDGYLSLNTSIPQIPVIHDLNFEHHPEDLPRKFRNYYRKYFPLFARKASHIITVSEYSKNDISKTYNVELSNITALWNGVSEKFQPINRDHKFEIQKQYSDGAAYFLFVGSLHPRKNLARLVEAYNRYCNYETNPWHLVIVGTELWKDSNNIKDSKNENIRFIGHLNQDELVEVMGAAESFVFVPYFEGFGIPLVEAMQSGVPVISGNLTSLPEVGGDAVLYCNPLNVADIQKCMGDVSSNLELRESLIEKGLKRAHLFSWDTTAQGVWEILNRFNQ